jgi:hypothetical protein
MHRIGQVIKVTVVKVVIIKYLARQSAFTRLQIFSKMQELLMTFCLLPSNFYCQGEEPIPFHPEKIGRLGMACPKGLWGKYRVI